MKYSFILWGSLLFLAGCIALPQTHVIPYRKDFLCHVDKKGGLNIGWQSESFEASKQADIDLASSWAVSPSGRKYAFNGVERTYFPGGKSRVKDITLFLRDPKTPAGEGSKSWSSGLWRIHITFTPRVPRAPIETDISISTFYYNPVLHGPPN